MFADCLTVRKTLVLSIDAIIHTSGREDGRPACIIRKKQSKLVEHLEKDE